MKRLLLVLGGIFIYSLCFAWPTDIETAKGRYYATYTCFISSWQTQSPTSGIFTSTTPIVGIGNVTDGMIKITDWKIMTDQNGSTIYINGISTITTSGITGSMPIYAGNYDSSKGSIIDNNTGSGAPVYGRTAAGLAGWTTVYVELSGD